MSLEVFRQRRRICGPERAVNRETVSRALGDVLKVYQKETAAGGGDQADLAGLCGAQGELHVFGGPGSGGAGGV